MSEEEAIDFFSKIFYGKHHIPGHKVIPHGNGWGVKSGHDISTFDSNLLTRLVIYAHDKCYRLTIAGLRKWYCEIIIWKRRGREGMVHERHPTIEQAISNFRGQHD